mmetsp:Transcript_29324/g.62358  ORF Transcript_29324/g.62358 Transcript_29324/m.62358 type:complete len:187 (-) Transcript_29324:197-757(-)
MELDYGIRMAQRQARLRGSPKGEPFCPGAKFDFEDKAELSSRVRDAQIQAQLKYHEPSFAVPQPTDALEPDDLLGTWTDSYGNVVSVYSTDAYKLSFVATLSRPPRRDINLTLTQVADGAGWQCGDALLDRFGSCYEQLFWVFPDGRVSIWIRKDIPTENCSLVSPSLFQDALPVVSSSASALDQI